MRAARILAGGAAIVVVSGTTSAQIGAARLRLDGLGPVRIGMTEAQVRAVAGDVVVGADREVDADCYYLASPGDRSVSFMIERGRVARIDIDDPHHWTLSGVHIGSTEAEAQAAYRGRLTVAPHKYDSTGHYLILKSADGTSALVLETDGKRVTSMRAGAEPAVEYVEGCL